MEADYPENGGLIPRLMTAMDTVRSKSFSGWAERFEHEEGPAPDPEDGLLEYKACLEVYEEMEALMDASPTLPSRHGRYHLKELREMMDEEAFGAGYLRAVGVELGPVDISGHP